MVTVAALKAAGYCRDVKQEVGLHHHQAWLHRPRLPVDMAVQQVQLHTLAQYFLKVRQFPIVHRYRLPIRRLSPDGLPVIAGNGTSFEQRFYGHECKITKKTLLTIHLSPFFRIFARKYSKTCYMENYFAEPKRYENGMKYQRCGRSGVLLPKVSLGFWHNFGGVDPYERSREITRYAFDHGITHFDLANNYGPPYGSAEETFGRLMDDDFRPYRDELFISTKAGYDMWPGPYGDWGSRKYLMASLDQSLKRMHLDYVDLFYSHRYDPETPLEETLQALVDIVRCGKALYVGISRWPLDATRFAFQYLKQRDVPCLIYQGKLNMLDREPQESGILDLCQEQGVGFISFSPLAQGLLTDRYLNGIPEESRMSKGKFLRPDMLTDELLEQLRRWNAEAEQRGQTLAEKALSWILEQPGVTSVLVGASSVQQLQKNLRCVM